MSVLRQLEVVHLDQCSNRSLHFVQLGQSHLVVSLEELELLDFEAALAKRSHQELLCDAWWNVREVESG